MESVVCNGLHFCMLINAGPENRLFISHKNLQYYGISRLFLRLGQGYKQ